VITFDQVRKVYPDGTVAVDTLDLCLPTGKITVFVGPSGCGKTTSLRMINRMIDPSEGRILIDDTDVATRDPAELRRGIGYVIQQGGLFPHRTVRDNIATVPVLLGVPKREARARAVDLLSRVGLEPELAGRYPAQLSGGQQQRVGVARALAANPPVMLLDEPFSAVDPVVRVRLRREFRRLQDELGKTIVFVTHDIDEAIDLGDMVAVFRQGGRLAQFGTPRDLLANPSDEFVADFVGRDRGFRGLSFDPAADLPLRPVDALDDGLELLVDADGRPTGWRLPRGVEPVGATFTAADSLRQVIDLAISSSVGAAVAVDDAGRVRGVITHSEIAEHLRTLRGSRP
jgi:osmoprotectant transport system ATP-binding protein